MSEKSMLERVQSVRNNEQTQLLRCIAQQNEEMLEVHKQKNNLLASIDQRDEVVMRMYRMKNLWSGIFGIIGLFLTFISTVFVGIGLYFLPNETQMLFNEVIALLWG